jgi:hypothetical protein
MEETPERLKALNRVWFIDFMAHPVVFGALRVWINICSVLFCSGKANLLRFVVRVGVLKLCSPRAFVNLINLHLFA